MKLFNTKLLIGLLVVLGAVISIAYATNSSARGQDCSSNAVIKCGISSVSDLKSKYNASSELQALYAHFGWSKSTINNATWATGYIYTDGTIKVNGKTVATNAISIGRNINSGSGCHGTPFKVNGKTYYQGTTKCRFGSADAQQALVMFDKNGKFIGAINMSCGNPTPATPVPVPVYTCDSLSAAKIDRITYKFTAKASVKDGATVKDYSFDFGDGKTATQTSNVIDHTYEKAGTYTVKVTVNFTVNGKTVSKTSSSCATKITVAPAPVYTCDLLTAQQLSRTTFEFTAKATGKNGASLQAYSFDFGDNTKSSSIRDTVRHTYKTPGEYTVKVHATFMVNNSIKSVTSEDCETTVKVAAQVEACNTETHEIVKVDKEDQNTPPYTTDYSQCQTVKVCDTTQTPPAIVEIYPNEMKDGYEDVDSPACHPVTPPTPPELPHTGIGNLLSSVFGLGSITAATYYYIASRRSY